MDPKCRSRLRYDSEFFFRTDPDQESLFNFVTSRSLRGNFLSEIMGKLRLDPIDSTRSLNKSGIVKIIKFLNPDPD